MIDEPVIDLADHFDPPVLRSLTEEERRRDFWNDALSKIDTKKILSEAATKMREEQELRNMGFCSIRQQFREPSMMERLVTITTIDP